MAVGRITGSFIQLTPDVVIEDAVFDISADVADFAGVDRLRVEALLAVGGPLVTDTDDDVIAAAQVLLLTINENYSFDGTNWRRFQSRAVSAAADEALMHVLTRSAVMGRDSGAVAGSQSVPIEARNMDVSGDVAAALVGILTNSRLAAQDLGTMDFAALSADLFSAVSGRTFTTPRGLYTAALSVGVDNTAAAVLRPVEARNLDADADIFAALIGLNTNSRLAVLGAADYQRLTGRSFGSGSVDEALFGMNVRAAVTGFDDSAVAGSRNVVVEARNLDSDGDVTELRVGLLTNSRLAAFNIQNSIYARLQAVGGSAVTSVNNRVGQLIYQPRESAFAASMMGRRYYVTHQTLGTFVTGQTVVADTTPTFMLRLLAAGVNAVVRSITLAQAGTVAGGTILVAAVLDEADRFSAGGTLVTPQGINEGISTAATATFRFNPTATAAGAGTRVLVQTSVAASLGSILNIDFKDGVHMTATSTLLVYTQAATTGPTWSFVFEFEEYPNT